MIHLNRKVFLPHTVYSLKCYEITIFILVPGLYFVFCLTSLTPQKRKKKQVKELIMKHTVY